MLKVEFKKIGRPEEQLYVTNYTLNERFKHRAANQARLLPKFPKIGWSPIRCDVGR